MRRGKALAALLVTAAVLYQQNFTVRLGPDGGYVCLDAFGCEVISLASYPPAPPADDAPDDAPSAAVAEIINL